MIYLVGGARPNFMKIAPLSRAFDKLNISYEIIHTGQHYDYEMNEIFFDQFKLKKPLHHLNVGSGNHGKQTGMIMDKFEEICLQKKPDMVFTVGDVNSTMATALVASKLHIPLAHQEAGMRSGDKKMPEEINRIVTDVISDYLFPISEDHQDNLLKEGISNEKIFLVGDVMIDNLLYYSKEIPIDNKEYCLVEIHRPANTDNINSLSSILKALQHISKHINVIFTIHPRTKKMIEKFYLTKYLKGIEVLNPVGYFEFLKLMKNAKAIITDSDGIQQESSVLNIQCISIRDTTNIQYTIDKGTNRLTYGADINSIINLTHDALLNPKKNKYDGLLKMLNDGEASNRIAQIINKRDIIQ